ncbi:MAG: hypothetical protein GX442_00880 [Candidatus Riflebacteria bacterium]|nr:hypothetical protein [Candidatus Riflebacteria bacterium]
MRHSPVVTIGALFLTVVLLTGCGGGGGGGEGGNPVGPAATGTFASLSGIVSYGGKPLANAAVNLYPSDAGLALGLGGLSAAKGSVRTALAAATGVGQFSTTSDANGGYAFEQVPVGEYTLVAILDATHQFARTGVVVGAITTVNAEIAPTGTLTGTISAPGADLTGGIVYLQGTSYVALTDQAGAFTISNVPASTTFSLRVTLGNHILSTPLSVMVAPGAATNVGVLALTAVALPGTGGLSGTVTRTGDSSQVGTLVLARKTTGEAAGVTLTNAAGDYRFYGLASGEYRLEFTADNYLPAVAGPVTVVPGTVATMAAVALSPKVFATPTGTLAGQASKTQLLADETDNRGISLLLVNPSGSHLVVTDTAGAFSFQAPHGPWRLCALSPWELLSGPGLTVVNGSATLSIPETTSLAGPIVVRPLVPPGPRYRFSGVITKIALLGDEKDHSGLNLLLTSPNGTFFATTDGAGNFAFDALPAGNYTLTVVGRYELATPYSFTLSSTLVASALTARPAVAPARYSFGGQVVKNPRLPDEATDGGLSLVLKQVPAGTPIFSAITDAGGYFLFSTIPSGTYEFSVQGRYSLAMPGASDTITIVNADVATGTYQARPFGAFTLSGRILKNVQLQGDIDDSGLSVVLKGPTGLQSTVTQPDGFYEFRQLPLGSYNLSVTGRYRLVEGVNGSDTFPVNSTPTIRDYHVNPAVPTVTVTGVATKSQFIFPGEDHSGLTVRLASAAANFQMDTTTDAAGAFSFPAIPLGVYDLRIVSENYRPEVVPPPVSVTAPTTVIPGFTVKPVSLLTGRVIGTVGGLTVGTLIDVVLTNSVTGARFVCRTDGTGKFAFENVPPTTGTDYHISMAPESGYILSGVPAPFAVGSKETVDRGTVFVVYNAPIINTLATSVPNVLVVNGGNIVVGPPSTRAFADGRELVATGPAWTVNVARFETSALAPGQYNLKLTNPDGLSTASGVFSVGLGVPVITSTGATVNSVTIQWDPVAFANSYQLTLSDGVATQTLMTTSNQHTFTDLPANQLHWVTVRGVSPNGPGPAAIRTVRTKVFLQEFVTRTTTVNLYSLPFKDAALVPGGNLFVMCGSDHNELHSIDFATGETVARLDSLSTGDVFAVLNANHVYVANDNADQLQVYTGDLTTPVVNAPLIPGAFYRRLYADPASQKIILMQHATGAATCSITVFGPNLETPVANHNIPITAGASSFEMYYGVSCLPGGRFIFLAGYADYQILDADNGFAQVGGGNVSVPIHGLHPRSPTVMGIGSFYPGSFDSNLTYVQVLGPNPGDISTLGGYQTFHSFVVDELGHRWGFSNLSQSQISEIIQEDVEGTPPPTTTTKFTSGATFSLVTPDLGRRMLFLDGTRDFIVTCGEDTAFNLAIRYWSFR